MFKDNVLSQWKSTSYSILLLERPKELVLKKLMGPDKQVVTI
jgi:hypothetical protein